MNLPDLPTDRVVLLGSDNGTWNDISEHLVHVRPDAPGHVATFEVDNSNARFTRIDEEPTFVASPACDSEGLLGYTSTRCAYRYLGCQDRACVCRCHDGAQPITDDEQHGPGRGETGQP